MLDNFQETLVGSLQIHREGFFDNPRLERHIERPQLILQALEECCIDPKRRAETLDINDFIELSAALKYN